MRGTDRSGGGNATIEAIEHLHRHGLFVVGGLIVGNPDDTRESIETNLEFARRYVDWPYIQHPTPYPRTPMTQQFREQNLIVDEDMSHYDGTTAVVRTKHVHGSRGRVPALARGTLDEAEASAGRVSPQPVVRDAALARDDEAHLCRNEPSIDSWPRSAAHRVRTLPEDATPRAHVRGTSRRSANRRPARSGRLKSAIRGIASALCTAEQATS